MKCFSICFVLSLSSSLVLADDLLDTAKAIKSILENGYIVSNIIAVEKTELMSIPPQRCIMLITERKPNILCPDNEFVGPNLDKGVAACFDFKTNELKHIGEFESQCD